MFEQKSRVQKLLQAQGLTVMRVVGDGHSQPSVLARQVALALF